MDSDDTLPPEVLVWAIIEIILLVLERQATRMEVLSKWMAHITIRAQKFLIIFGSTYGKNNRQRSIDIRRTKWHLTVAKEKQIPSIHTLLVLHAFTWSEIVSNGSRSYHWHWIFLSTYTVYIVSLGPCIIQVGRFDGCALRGCRSIKRGGGFGWHRLCISDWNIVIPPHSKEN